MINNIFQKILGVKLIRVGIPFHKKQLLAKTPPVLIEFIGVSGVGKSTLFNRLNKKNKWISLNDFINQFPYQSPNKLFENLHTHQILGEYKILETLNNPTYNLATIKLNKLNFYYETLIADGKVTKYNKSNTVISEEGLFQMYTNCILKLNNETLINTLVKNRAFIYCEAPIKTIQERIKIRQGRTGNIRFEHDLEDGELFETIEKELKTKRLLLIILEKHNISILKINTTLPIKENIQKINDFINKLHNSL